MPGRRKDGQAGKYLFPRFERQTVSALVDRRVCLVSAYGDRVQRAEILRLFMVFALVYGAADRLIT